MHVPKINGLFEDRRFKRGLRLSLALLFLFGLLPAIIICWDGLRDEAGRADVAVILGNKIELNGQPSARLRARLQRGLDVYRAGQADYLLVSGGVGKEGFDEAEVMKRWLVEQGAPGDRIITDSQGNNSWLTAQNTQRIMRERGFSSAMIVTQYFHVPRCRMAFRKFGIQRITTAHADYFEIRDIFSVPREVAGYYAYTLKKSPLPSDESS